MRPCWIQAAESGGWVLGIVARRKPAKRKAVPTARERAKAVISSATEFKAPPKPKVIVPRAMGGTLRIAPKRQNTRKVAASQPKAAPAQKSSRSHDECRH